MFIIYNWEISKMLIRLLLVFITTLQFSTASADVNSMAEAKAYVQSLTDSVTWLVQSQTVDGPQQLMDLINSLKAISSGLESSNAGGQSLNRPKGDLIATYRKNESNVKSLIKTLNADDERGFDLEHSLRDPSLAKALSEVRKAAFALFSTHYWRYPFLELAPGYLQDAAVRVSSAMGLVGRPAAGERVARSLDEATGVVTNLQQLATQGLETEGRRRRMGFADLIENYRNASKKARLAFGITEESISNQAALAACKQILNVEKPSAHKVGPRTISN
jgi:hypothetical protein